MFDALRYASLLLPREFRAKGGEMLVAVVVAVPEPDSVDSERVKQEVPHGEVTVRAVQGGLKVPNYDNLIANAAITVSARFPDEATNVLDKA